MQLDTYSRPPSQAAMKVGKDEEKHMNPLFPRLHISDADKRGPRAPPRNKMALCEQFSTSTPSPGSMSMPPLPSNIPNSIPEASSSHVTCNKKSLFSLSHKSPESSHFVEILHPHSSGAMNFTMGRPDVRLKQVLSLQGNFPSTSQCNPFQPHSLLYSNSNPCLKPLNHGDIPKNVDTEKIVISSSKPCSKIQGKETISQQLKWREVILSKARDLSEKSERRAKLLSNQEKSVVSGDSSPVDSIPENRCGLVGDLNKSNSETNEDCWILHKRKATADGITNDLSCSFLPHEDRHRTPKRVKSSSDYPKGQISEPPEVEGTDRREEISEASSSNSGLVEKVSSDKLIELIGQELFWKARRTIAHQQRIYAIQLFELHRVTKVQKLIAGSPDILFQSNFYLQQPSIKFPSLKMPCDDVVEQKVTPKPNNVEHPGEKPYEKLHPVSKDDDKMHLSQQTAKKQNIGKPTLRSFLSDSKLAPQHLQPPPGFQWLVPIRSPSEGLVYKPYTGPCPPPSGFMAPIYGSCRPVPLSSISGDFPNMPTPHRPGPSILDQACIQPYSMPVIKPYGSSSAAEQMNQLSRIRSSDQREITPLMHDVDLVRPHKNTCNVSDRKSGVISECDRTFQADRGSDLQASTASSPAERVQRDALSLFPVTPTPKVSDDNMAEQRIKVIKVVPHNPKSASESAARIFRSIQEERKLNL